MSLYNVPWRGSYLSKRTVMIDSDAVCRGGCRRARGPSAARETFLMEDARGAGSSRPGAEADGVHSQGFPSQSGPRVGSWGFLSSREPWGRPPGKVTKPLAWEEVLTSGLSNLCGRSGSGSFCNGQVGRVTSAVGWVGRRGRPNCPAGLRWVKSPRGRAGLRRRLGGFRTMSPHAVLGLVLQVTMPGEPVDVACGVDHMVTLAKSFI